MALKIYDKIAPSGDFPVVDSSHVEMPDGTRLSEATFGGGGTDPRVDVLIEEVGAMFDEDGKVKPEYLPDGIGGTDPRVDGLIETVGAVFDENGKVKEEYLPEDWVRGFVEEYIDEALRGDY